MTNLLLASMLATLGTSNLAAPPSAGNAPIPSTSFFERASVMATPALPIPAGYGKYCSIVYPSGAWAFSFVDANKDPCQDMLTSTPGGTVKRAGLWDGSGDNNVTYQCSGGGIGLQKNHGDKALKAAFDDALGQTGCVFTVAPRKLPIFSHPFPTAASLPMSQGFDFAHGFTVKDNNGVLRNAVNNKGNAVAYDGHNGFDWPMPTGTKITAMAKGRVLIAQSRNVSQFCPNEDELIQNEMFVMHVVGTGRYKEIFVAYYAHFDSMSVAAGDIVQAGQKLGTAGDTGCSTTPHLHLGIVRGSNTAAHYRVNLDSPTASGYTIQTDIDPYAFSWGAEAEFDPWAWRKMNEGHGALSINLWKSGQAPKRD